MSMAEKRLEWDKIVDEFKLSGKNQATFSREKGIDSRNLSRWIKKVKATSIVEGDSNNWVSISINNTIDNSENRLVVKIGNAEIIIEKGIDKAVFLDVATVLNKLC